MTISIEKSQNWASTSAKADIKLKHIIKTLPRECFQKNRRKAWTTVLINVLMVGLGYWGIASAPSFLLPLFWIFTGTALTGFFVIAHDCGHRSFANRKWVNDLVGHILMLPLIYPFHGWRIQHNVHHKHTNKLDVDNAWNPPSPEFYASVPALWRPLFKAVRWRLWWLGSIGHWAMMHFDWRQFQGKQREQVKFSALVVIAFAIVAFPILFATTGLWGVFKFWLMPWMVYHFWMSTFTLVHHTAPDIPFRTVDKWNEAEAQLSGTVHCDYPGWVEFLCHDINVHVPHHLSTAIPWYNLRSAHSSLRQNWRDSLYECRFSWSLMKKITDKCHFYHPDNCYYSYQEYYAQNHQK